MRACTLAESKWSTCLASKGYFTQPTESNCITYKAKLHDFGSEHLREHCSILTDLSRVTEMRIPVNLAMFSNQITFIGLVSGKNYFGRPRIITVIA